ncbi:MFS transporter [Streptomyces sp. NPDC050844]|uniref:MFS transporter n=1 Tax=Streptomyces sp. NPDC050844 TaxID=3155790 RepID=UPI0033F19057
MAPTELTEAGRPRRPTAGYRELIRVPGFWRLATVGMVSKIPPAMAGLSLLLLIGRDYAYTTAGLAFSGSAIGQGLTAPLRGRLVDRHSPRPVLLTCLAGYLTATVLLIALLLIPAVLCLAAVIGWSTRERGRALSPAPRQAGA